MSIALLKANQFVKDWIENHKKSYPPIVINITDGESIDIESYRSARELMNLRTDDGNVLLFNSLIAFVANAPVIFADNSEIFADDREKQIFEISSPLTQEMVYSAQNMGFQVSEKSRGVAFQEGLVDVIRFLELGTRPAGLGKSRLPARSLTNIKEIVFSVPDDRRVTPNFLSTVISPYLTALAYIQKVIIESQHKSFQEVYVIRISQSSPISVSLDGASEAIQTIKETVTPWRRKHAETMANLIEQEKIVEIENGKASVLAKRAEAAKERAETDKLKAEIDKSKQETDRLKLENEKLRLEIQQVKIQLALDILTRIAPNLSETDKIGYLIKLLQPLDTVISSELEMA